MDRPILFQMLLYVLGGYYHSVCVNLYVLQMQLYLPRLSRAAQDGIATEPSVFPAKSDGPRFH